MKTKIAILLQCVFLFCTGSAIAITIETVPIGDVGNPNDPADGDAGTSGIQNLGNVNYAYNIGKYEVTVGQYAAFLNAVAATDTYALYNTSMASDLSIAGISRSGASGSYTYSVIGSANHPVTYVNWGDAARFTNWLNNGQPTGPEGPGTTETGAYPLNGATSGAALLAITRNVGAKWFIPTENEWYKAAYYQPAAAGGDSDGYWQYPMMTNSVPYSAQPPGTTATDPTHVGNFFADDGITNGYDNGYAVTGSTSNSDTQNYLTDVGAYTSSPTYYGTFDQGGNVWEWNETKFNSQRGARGGSWFDIFVFSNSLQASYRDSLGPTSNGSFNPIGFRVASVFQLPGDFNQNGVVDAADYLLWRNDPSSYGGSPTGYGTWRANFGLTGGSGVEFDNTAQVPEPTDAVLLVVGLVAMHYRRWNYLR